MQLSKSSSLSLKNLQSSFLKAVLLFFISFLSVSFTFLDQDRVDPIDKQKAIFCFAFTQHVEWPASMKEGDFIIGVVGNPNITKEFERLATIKKVGERKVIIKSFNAVKDIERCQILYVPVERSSELGAILSKCQGKSILVVSEKEGLAKKGGSIINFIFKDNKVSFEYNSINAGKFGLKIGSYLTSFGKEITD